MRFFNILWLWFPGLGRPWLPRMPFWCPWHLLKYMGYHGFIDDKPRCFADETAAQATSMWPGVLRRKVREFSGGSYGIISPGNTSLYELKMVQLNIPSGYVKIAIENSHRNSGFSHETWWFSSSLCKRLPGRVTYSHGYVCILKRFLLVHHHDCHDYIYIYIFFLLPVWNVIMYHHLIIIWSCCQLEHLTSLFISLIVDEISKELQAVYIVWLFRWKFGNPISSLGSSRHREVCSQSPYDLWRFPELKVQREVCLPDLDGPGFPV